VHFALLYAPYVASRLPHIEAKRTLTQACRTADNLIDVIIL